MKPWKYLRKIEKNPGKIFRYEQQEFKSQISSKRGLFDVLHFPHWVNVIALTPQDQMLLVRQHRFGTNELCWELPGGAMDAGEGDPLVAAQRELLEETGFQARDWRGLSELSANPAFLSNRCTTFTATGAHRVGEQQLDELEEIEVQKFSLPQVRQMLVSGEIHHSLIVAALALFFLKKA